jgi:adenosine deaminase
VGATTPASGGTGQPDPALLAWCRRVPKVELHLHLEGAIPHPTLLELVRKYDPAGPVGDLDTLVERFRYRDFPHFLDVWNWKHGFLREADDFALIAEAVARDLAGQRVRYAEMSFSPTDVAALGLSVGELAVAIRAGLDRVAGIQVGLIVDLVRDNGPERAARTLAEAAEVRELGVVGIGIGGSEHDFPPEPFGPVYERARALGLHTTVHAGEAAGPASVWGALTLAPDRIGHGTRAAEDRRLVEHLAAHQVPLEMCPVSNVRTGVVPSLAAHPIGEFFAAGIPVTVNTDDPAMFDTSLALEYALLMEGLGFTPDGIRTLVLNAVAASWLPQDQRAELAAEVGTHAAWTAPAPVSSP